MSADVFISYATDDRDVAMQVCALLETRGIACWIAPRDVPAGTKWDEAILDAIETSPVFLLLLSRHANNSPFVQNEVNRAFGERKPIVTFRTEDVLPGRSLQLYLARHHWTDGFPAPMEEKVDRLAASIAALLGKAVPVSAAASVGTVGIGSFHVLPRITRRLRFQWIARCRAALGRMPRRERLSWGVGAALGLLAAVLGVVLARSPSPAATTVTRTLISVAPADRLQSHSDDQTGGEGRPTRTVMALSPDGLSLVFSAVRGNRQQLYVRALDQLEATPIVGTEDGANPFFSPDGKWIGFWAGNALKKVALRGGGPAIKICDAPANSALGGVGLFGASWGSNDRIVFAQQVFGGLWQVSADGGTPEALTTRKAKDGEVSHRLPQILPGNQAVLFTVTRNQLPRWDDTTIVVQSLTTGARKVLIEGGADARYVPTGHLVYVRAGTLMAVPFDLGRLAVTGSPVGMVSDVMQAANMRLGARDSGAGQFSVSASGSLIFVPGGIAPDPESSLVWVDRSGAIQPLAAPPRPYLSPRLSPDGQRVAFHTTGRDRNVWVHDILRGTQTRLTLDGRNTWSVWTPDGKRITFGSAVTGIENLFWQPSDGIGAAERLGVSENIQGPSSWSPDGQTLAFVETRPATASDIWVLPLGGDRRPRPIVQTQFNENFPEFSPDGRWLAYVSDETGRQEVYVQPYPGPGARQQISANGANAPAWARDGHELFYVAPGPDGQPTIGRSVMRMMAVPITIDPSFTADAPRLLFEGRYISTVQIRGYDVTPDGRRFLMVQGKDGATANPTHMILVQNWFEELNRRVPAK